MDSKDPIQAIPIHQDSEPVPVLNYDEPYERTIFQQACIDFSDAYAFTDFGVTEWTYGGENHIAIPLLASDELNAKESPGDRDNSKVVYLGMMIGPRGLYQTFWGYSDDTIIQSDRWQFLRHPAELEDIRIAYAREPFSESRSESPDPSCYYEAYSGGTPIYEAKLDPQYTKRHIKFEDMLEGVFILLEEEPFEGKLLPISKLLISKEGKELLREIETSAIKEGAYGTGSQSPHWSDRHIDDAYNCWDGNLLTFYNKANSIAGDLRDSLTKASYHDVVLGYAGEVTSVQLLGTLHGYSCGAPKIALRPNKKNIALTRFLDLLAVGNDIRKILDNLACWRKLAKQKNFELERDVHDQMRASISHRRCMEDYAFDVSCESYGNYFGQRSTISLDQDERRLQSLQESYETFLNKGYKDILAMPGPRLPHFLEIAYQRFTDSSSDRSRSIQGRNLLNLLGRSILYFMLEDLSASEISNDKINDIERELYGKKSPSDGRLLDLQLSLIKSIPSEQLECLVTGSLMMEIPDIIKKHLLPLVEKRNRANHPPFDEDGFLRETNKQFPLAIEALRKGFRNIELIVPIHFKSNSDGDVVITAKSLTGSHFEYPENSLDTAIGFNKTPTDTLMLCYVWPLQSGPALSHPSSINNQQSATPNTNPTASIKERVEEYNTAKKSMQNRQSTCIFGAAPLRKFFDKKYGYKKMIMTGVFDRVDKGEPVFEYIEE